MPRFDSSNQAEFFDLFTPGLADYASYFAHTPTSYRYVTSDGHLVSLFGTGFVVDGGSMPTGGTVTHATIDLSQDDPSDPDIVMTELNFALTALDFSAGAAANNSFWSTVLAGATTVFPVVANASVMAGDFITYDSAVPFQSGNDLLLGADIVGTAIYGDGFTLTSGLVFGGNDTFWRTHDLRVGDVGLVHGQLVGGDDSLFYQLNWTADAGLSAFGDALAVFNGGSLFGGNDLFAANLMSGQTGQNVFVGDAQQISSGALAQGGQDTVRGSQSDDLIVGDFQEVQDGAAAFGGDDSLLGMAGADVIHGDFATDESSQSEGGDDILDGGAGNDTLFGDGGNDTLIGGLGGDLMDGGAGIDVVSYEGAQEGVRALLNGTMGTIGEATGDVISNVENIIGSAFDDRLSGSFTNNVLRGGAGDDTLLAAAGDDTLIGGAGSDLMLGQSGVDWVDYTIATAAVGGRLDGIAGFGGALGDVLINIENMLGSASGDTLIGSAGANEIDGGEGNDTLFGGGGDDRLLGALGDDVLYGQNGDDHLLGGAGDDTLFGGAGADTMFGGAGIDVVTYAASAAAIHAELNGQPGSRFSAQGDVLHEIEILVGSAFDDTLGGSFRGDQIIGGAGNDFIFGGGGDDTLEGGAGADRFFGQQGVDLISYANAATGVGARLDGMAGFAGEATGDIAVRAENLLGSAHADTLVGDDTDNLLSGGNGDDMIFAGLGADTLLGDVGNDVLHGQGGWDTFVFTDGFGQDIIHRFAANTGLERIDFSNLTTLTDFASLAGNGHMAQVGGDVVIDDHAGNTLTLLGVQLSALDATDFIF